MKVYCVLSTLGYEAGEYNLEIFAAKEDAEVYRDSQRTMAYWDSIEILEKIVEGV